MAEAPRITLVTDFAAASDFEKKHAPFMTVEPKDDHFVVTVEVGHEVAHPNGVDHYITDIELFVGDVSIARVDLAPAVTAPTFSLALALPAGTVVRAVEHCNLHGWWAFEVAL
jgi:superoxide reductase